MARAIDLTGQRFGRLVVEKRIGAVRRATYCKTYWHCKCDCGAVASVTQGNLHNGNTRSCGCLRRSEQRSPLKAQHPAEYLAWINMRKRCRSHERYAGRGIECRFKSFSDFLKCIGPRPSADYSVERIDNDGHYEAGNVRWATRTEQMRNTDANIFIEMGWQTRCLQDWCNELKKPYATVRARVKRYKWNPLRALTT